MAENKKQKFKSWHAKIIAVICAIALWMYVEYENNPITDTTIEVPINYQNLSSEYIQLEKTQNVWVTFSGREDKISLIRASDVSAVVDLAEAQIGDNELVVTIQSDYNNYLSNVQPANAKTYIDQWSDITLQIEPEIVGEIAEGYKQFAPSISPTTVDVTGPSTYLEQLDHARVQIDITGIESSMTKTLPITLINKNGEVVNNGQLLTSVSNVEVYVPIDQEIPSKTVVITPVLSGTPANNYKVERIVTEPETVRISAPADILNGITSIDTESIDISNITEDGVYEVPLVLPQGVSFAGTHSAKVFVSLSSTQSTQAIAYPIEILGAKDNWQVELSQTEAEVTVSGDESSISAEALNVSVYVNVQDLGIGTHTVSTSVSNSGALQLTNVTPAVVTVTITEKTETNEAN